jgi:hypothetical protein
MSIWTSVCLSVYKVFSSIANALSGVLIAPIPSLPATFVNNNKPLAKTVRGLQDVSTLPRLQITSSPTTVGTAAKKSPPQNQGYRFNTIAMSTGQNFETSGQDNDIEKWIIDNFPHKRPDKRVASITSLSSSSSCEMYTDSDMSDEQQETEVDFPRLALPKPTHKVINVIMRKLEVNLRFAAFMQCNGGNTSNASSTNTIRSQHSNRKPSQRAGKRKLGSDYNLPPNDNDEEDNPNKRRRGSLATVASSDTSTRFACPFYKHEPHRFRNRRTCPGPGWPTVHRMKEHLYRAHAQSIYCPRCYATFDADTDLSTHLRSAQCQVSDPQPIEGIDRETLKALHKRSPAFRLEEDKWRDVYRHLFPDVAVEDIPSPCTYFSIPNTSIHNLTWHIVYTTSSPSDSSRLFRRALLRRVHQELVTTATHLPSPAEQRLLQQVASIVRRCEKELLNTFDAESIAVPALMDRRASDTSTLSNVSAQETTTPGDTTPVPAYSGHLGLGSQGQEGVSVGGGDETWREQSGYAERTVHPTFAWDPQLLTQDSIVGWMDLGSVFPPPPDDTCAESFVDFNTAMWTRQ